MAYQITSQCISCKLCQPVCPTGAVKIEEDGRHWIDQKLCTNCADTVYTVPQCQAGCPTCNGCVKVPSDYWEGWFEKYNRVIAKLTKKQDYWDSWFNCYSQKYQLSNKTIYSFYKLSSIFASMPMSAMNIYVAIYTTFISTFRRILAF